MNNIDIDKSIKSNKLVYTNLIEKFFVELHMIAIFGSLIYAFSYESFLKIIITDIESLLIPIITILIIILLVYWYLKNDKLLRKKNILNEKNKLIIEKYLYQLTEQREWEFVNNSEHVKIMNIPMEQVQIGLYSRLYVIYDNDDLLLNFSSFGFFGLKPPFNYLCNRNLENKIVSKIKTKIKNAA